MKLPAALLLCLLAAPLALAGQDMGGGSNDCDLKKIEKGWFCEKCDQIVEKDDLDKDGKHKECKEKAAEVKLCVRTYYEAECCGTRHEDEGS